MWRKIINFPVDLIEQVDNARGLISFSAWVRDACLLKLKRGE